MARFQVMIDDNFHFMDESYRLRGPECETYEEAVAWCQRFVEEQLREMHKPGMDAAALIEGYKAFGEDPFVTTEPEGQHFSAWRYAEAIAEQVCRQASPGSEPASGS